MFLSSLMFFIVVFVVVVIILLLFLCCLCHFSSVVELCFCCVVSLFIVFGVT